MEYVKIHSLWKRQGWYLEQGENFTQEQQKNRQSFIIGDYACPEFGNVKYWHVTEKVDGTNIRIYLNKNADECDVQFCGRTSTAAIPGPLVNVLKNKFTKELLTKAIDLGSCTQCVLYGEGYGARIQEPGKRYRGDVGFILFDVILGKTWLGRESVKQLASKLDIPIVPDLGVMTEDAIVTYVKSKPLSQCSIVPQVMEGIVARSEPMLYFKHGNPVMWKLKCKEF